MFDADVTVPIRRGQVDFDDATVEHVGPDSRMGVSPQGLYVDGANGRTYLYEFTSPAVPGIEFEKRAAWLGTMVSDRGKIQLQAFIEGVFRGGLFEQGRGITPRTLALFTRTAVSGELQLADGTLGLAGIRAAFAKRSEGRNAVHLESSSVASGVTLRIPALHLAEVVLDAEGMQFTAEAVSGEIVVTLSIDAGLVRCAVQVDKAAITGLKLNHVSLAVVSAKEDSV